MNRVTLLVSILLLFLFSCAPASRVPEVKQTAPSQDVAARPETPSWQVEWEKTLVEARKEGKLVLQTTAVSDIRLAIAQALKKYGIELESIAGKGAEMAEKTIRERKVGIYAADVNISGFTTTLTQLKPAGVLASWETLLILPDVRDPKMWYKEQLPFSDKDKTILAYAAYPNGDFHINSSMIKPGELNSMMDLLSPKWEGKIIMDDPTVNGRGNNVMAAYTIRLGDDYIKQLAKQKPLLTRDKRLIIDWVVKGRYPIGIGVYPDSFAEYQRAGAPISSILFNEAAFLDAGAGFVTFFDRAPHPAASKVFLNWLLSKEGQTMWSKLANAQSARLDVPTDHLKIEGVHLREPGIDYLEAAKEKWVLELKAKAEKVLMDTYIPLR